ncbi:MAG: RloB family protein [Pirellulaceae bacterium]
MPRRNRDRRPARRTPVQERKRLILVVTEGKVTEPAYLYSFQKKIGRSAITLDVRGIGGAPRTIVENAVALKQELLEDPGDQVWAVFDTDDHANLANSIQMARDNGIHVALSNPCFELWLLLHFQDSPGMQHRDKITAMVRQHVPGYRKSIRFDQCQAGYDEAVRRAARLYEQAELDVEPYRNPVTGVHLLTEELRGG